MITTDLATRSVDALNAYGQTQQTLNASTDGLAGDGTEGASSDVVSSFGSVLNSAIQGAIQTQKTSEAQTALGVSGQGNLTDIATSVAEAKLTLQTVTTVRDKIVQAYQDVMKMSI